MHSFDTRAKCFRHGSTFQLGCVFVDGVGIMRSVALKNALNYLCQVTPDLPNNSLHMVEPFTGSPASLLNFMSSQGEDNIACNRYKDKSDMSSHFVKSVKSAYLPPRFTTLEIIAFKFSHAVMSSMVTTLG